MTTFAELGVPTALTDVLDRDGKTVAFPIQESTLPDSLAGRDVLGRGKTGSGKTLAFSLPIAARLGRTGNRAKPGRPRALVLAPTRELATQIDAVIRPLAAAHGLTTTTIYGGVSQQRQEQAMKRGVDIVVACPGRLEDLMRQGIVRLDAVQITVLDEADHMADLGFLPGVTRIMAATPRQGQRLLFSATLDRGVKKLVDRFLAEPITHEVDGEDSHVDAMTHHVFHVADAGAKKDLVRTLASGTGRRVLFTRTKHQAKKLASQLTADGIPAVDLHGNLSQAARDRNLAAFAGDGARVLVATDVAARGIHVDGIELVVHVDPPAEHKAYLHRSGRTARAGAAGEVVTIVLPEQLADVRTMTRQAGITATPQRVAPGAQVLHSLVGELADPVAPAPAAAPAAPARTPGRARATGSRPGTGDRPGAEGVSASDGPRRPRRRRGGQGRGGAAAGTGQSGQSAGRAGGAQQRTTAPTTSQRASAPRGAAPRAAAPRSGATTPVPARRPGARRAGRAAGAPDGR